MFRTIAEKLKGRTKTVDKTLTDKELVDLLDEYAISGSGVVQRANVKYVNDARRYNYPLDGLENMSLFDAKEMFLQKLRAEAHTRAPAETSKYTDIDHQVYAGNHSEKHYITIVHGNLRHTFGTTIIKGSPHSTASIDFVVEKKYSPGTIAPVG